MKNIDVDEIKKNVMNLSFRDWKECKDTIDMARHDSRIKSPNTSIDKLIELCRGMTDRQWFAVKSAIDCQFMCKFDYLKLDHIDDKFFKFSINAGL